MAIYTPIVDALSELGADDIGKVVGKVGSVGGRILLHQISKHTGIDLSDPDNKQNAEEAAKRLLDDRKGFRSFKLELRRIAQTVELREIESNQVLAEKNYSLYEIELKSDDRKIRLLRPRLATYNSAFTGIFILTMVFILVAEVWFSVAWFRECMEAEDSAGCFEYLGDRKSFVNLYITLLSTTGMLALISGIQMHNAFYFYRRSTEKIQGKDGTDSFAENVKNKVRKVLPPYRKTQPEEQVAPVERRERVLPRKMPEGAYKRTDDEPIPPVEGIKKLMPNEPPLPPVRR